MKERKRRGIIAAIVCIALLIGVSFGISLVNNYGEKMVKKDLSIECPAGWEKVCDFGTEYYYEPTDPEQLEYGNKYMHVNLAFLNKNQNESFDYVDPTIFIGYYMPLNAEPGDKIKKKDKETYERLFEKYNSLTEDKPVKYGDISFIENNEGDLYLRAGLKKDSRPYIYFRPIYEGLWFVVSTADVAGDEQLFKEAEEMILSMKDTDRLRELAIKEMQKDYADFALLKDDPENYPIPDLAYRNRNLKIFIPIAVVVLLIIAIVVNTLRSRNKKDEIKSYRPKVMVEIKCEKCGKVFQREAEKGSEEFVRNTYRLCPECYKQYKDHQKTVADRMGQFTIH